MFIIQKNNIERILYLDILRILSIFGVVVLHVSAPFLTTLDSNGIQWWWSGNIFDSLSRWCVPVLIMISGKLILGSKKYNDIGEFLGKRLTKILIPLIFWSILYFIWVGRSNLSLDITLIIGILTRIYEGSIVTHFWYLYMLIGLYLFTPIIKPFIQDYNKSGTKYFLFIWFIANGIFEFIGRLSGLNSGIYLQLFHWSLGFYVLGYFLDREDMKPKNRIILYILGFIGLMSTIFGTYYLMSKSNGVFRDNFYSYLAPNVIFTAIGVFVLFKYIKWEKIIPAGGFLQRAVQSINKTSFGIYLVHPLIIDILKSGYIGINIYPLMFNHVIGIPLIGIVVFILSHIIIWLIQRIPIFRKVV